MCDYAEPNPSRRDATENAALPTEPPRPGVAPAPLREPDSGSPQLDSQIVTATLIRHLDRVAQSAVAKSGRREIEPASILARVLCRVAPQLDRWGGRRPELQRYLVTAIRHEIINELRRLRRAPCALPPDPEGPRDQQGRAPEPAVPGTSDRAAAFLSAVHALGLGDLAERLVDLRGCRGLSWEQVGIEVGITAEHARTKWHQVRERILRGVVRPLRDRLSALDAAIVDALVVRGLPVAAAADELALGRDELYDRMVFVVVPLLHDAYGSAGVAAMHRLGRRAKLRGEGAEG